MGSPPPFLSKLFALVNDSYWNELIRWENNGQTFIITDPIEFSKKILPSYFKHKNFSSFLRQLNKYGFSKLSPDEWIFGHKEFKYGKQDQLSGIIRKKKLKTNYLNFSGENIQQLNKKIEADIDFLKRSRQSFSKNFIDIYSRQEQFLIQQQNIEINQKKLESEVKILENEVCQLKGFIFGYLSKVIGKGDEKSKISDLPFFLPNEQRSSESLSKTTKNPFNFYEKFPKEEKIVFFN
ncbi:hsf (nucleomorph) [Hemiselmis andersenii]|uniref:Hsf n=1 Tax=Hemiselmis andersenii TaxID=464988 RepID=A9BKD9_HEMAN|nr:hsf [Hemiselmis andersenii]ABW97972.1 hsf [Hemiselmis andersenii]|mmetsp:Transcript_39452/g.92271  ORF Transcript_39452/g.92271 Transcript_39452/m.92271 type:complete len:237 (-) Transcript_39452:131-841(-)